MHERDRCLYFNRPDTPTHSWHIFMPLCAMYVLACDNIVAGTDFRCPNRPIPEDMLLSLRYYSASVHKAAFKLPVFAESVIAPVRKVRGVQY